jgi:hypothetical protein
MVMVKMVILTIDNLGNSKFLWSWSWSDYSFSRNSEKYENRTVPKSLNSCSPLSNERKSSHVDSL